LGAAGFGRALGLGRGVSGSRAVAGAVFGSAFGSGTIAGAASVGSDRTSTGSGAAGAAAGAACKSGVGASTSIEFPTIAMLFGGSTWRCSANARVAFTANGSSTTHACSPNETISAGALESRVGIAKLLIS
jgi:hypothetical protein